MIYKRKSYLSLFLSVLLLDGCGGTIGGNPEKSSDPTPNNPATGETAALSFSLTDAPVDDAQHVYVTIAEVQIKQDEGDWITIPLETESEIDLLALQDGKSTALASIETLSPGTYKQTRLILSDSVASRLVDNDGVEHELKIPSGSESGLKIDSAYTVEEGVPLHLTIDFDLRKSIKTTGNGNGKNYQMKPVLRLVETDASGGIKGEAENADLVCFYKSDAVVDGDDSCSNAESSARVKEGSFQQSFLSAGTYTLVFFKDGSQTETKASIVIESGEVTEL